MKYEIKQYKGQTIEYDDDLDKFVCDITIEDRNKTSKRGSLKDLEKEIDQFIKQNLEFKPFKLFEKRSYGNSLDVIHVEGIRTDGRFTCKKEWDGKIRNSFDLVKFEDEIKGGDEFFFYDPEVVREMKEIALEEEGYREVIRRKEKVALKKLKKFDLATIKKYTDAFAKS